MSKTAPVKIADNLSRLAGLILVLVPFHAFLTVWLSSGVGHYTGLRLWKEFLLVPIILGSLYILWKDKKLRSRLFTLGLSKLILAYIALLIAVGFIALANHGVTGKALWYGLLVDLRFMVFFLAILVLAAKSDWLAQNYKKLIFIPAMIVAVFAIAQFLVLPYDFLRHFGYGPKTISPYETINHNLQHIRVASTLRGANPLGAYLIVPISILAAEFFKNRLGRRDKAMLGAGLLLALIFSFSRSAWIGVILSVLVIAWLSYRSLASRKIIGWWLAGALALACVLILLLRNNLSFENALFHTDHKSTIATSSNEGHSTAFKSAVKDIAHNPLGSGVGTAGPQSTYNYGHRGRISENFFLQIGQEAGLAGMLLFIIICFALAKVLYEGRDSQLYSALLASFLALSLVNMLSHAWTDDTLAYIWWGLAGIALAPILTDRAKAKNGEKIKKP